MYTTLTEVQKIQQKHLQDRKKVYDSSISRSTWPEQFISVHPLVRQDFDQSQKSKSFKDLTSSECSEKTPLKLTKARRNGPSSPWKEPIRRSPSHWDAAATTAALSENQPAFKSPLTTGTLERGGSRNLDTSGTSTRKWNLGTLSQGPTTSGTLERGGSRNLDTSATSTRKLNLGTLSQGPTTSGNYETQNDQQLEAFPLDSGRATSRNPSGTSTKQPTLGRLGGTRKTDLNGTSRRRLGSKGNLVQNLDTSDSTGVRTTSARRPLDESGTSSAATVQRMAAGGSYSADRRARFSGQSQPASSGTVTPGRTTRGNSIDASTLWNRPQTAPLTRPRPSAPSIPSTPAGPSEDINIKVDLTVRPATSAGHETFRRSGEFGDEGTVQTLTTSEMLKNAEGQLRSPIRPIQMQPPTHSADREITVSPKHMVVVRTPQALITQDSLTGRTYGTKDGTLKTRGSNEGTQAGEALSLDGTSATMHSMLDTSLRDNKSIAKGLVQKPRFVLDRNESIPEEKETGCHVPFLADGFRGRERLAPNSCTPQPDPLDIPTLVPDGSITELPSYEMNTSRGTNSLESLRSSPRLQRTYSARRPRRKRMEETEKRLPRPATSPLHLLPRRKEQGVQQLVSPRSADTNVSGTASRNKEIIQRLSANNSSAPPSTESPKPLWTSHFAPQAPSQHTLSSPSQSKMPPKDYHPAPYIVHTYVMGWKLATPCQQSDGSFDISGLKDSLQSTGISNNNNNKYRKPGPLSKRTKSRVQDAEKRSISRQAHSRTTHSHQIIEQARRLRGPRPRRRSKRSQKITLMYPASQLTRNVSSSVDLQGSSTAEPYLSFINSKSSLLEEDRTGFKTKPSKTILQPNSHADHIEPSAKNNDKRMRPLTIKIK